MPSVKSGRFNKLDSKIFSWKTLARMALVQSSAAAVRKPSLKIAVHEKSSPRKALLPNDIRAHAQFALWDSSNTALFITKQITGAVSTTKII